MAQDTASEAACWVHIDKDSERLVFTRGAEPHDSISCPVAWVPMILDLVQRDAPDAFNAWVDEHMVDTLDAHYDVGYNAGYSHGFGEGSRA